MHLGEVLPVQAQPVEEHKSIAAHTRRVAHKDGAADTGEALPFFDETKVPIQTIVLMHADAKDLKSDECEIIGEKVTYRLAQRPGSYVILKDHRPFIQLKEQKVILR